MVALVRQGVSLRQTARTFRVSLLTVQRWVQRAQGLPLDQVDWRDRPSQPWRTQRTALAVEDRILQLRQELRQGSDLGEYGAVAIHRALVDDGDPVIPAVRTIGRILERRGVLDGHQRRRRPPPPLGWYLPAVAAGDAEIDSLDSVEGLVIRGGPQVEVLTLISVHGGLVAAWPEAGLSAKLVVTRLLAHWQAWGLPTYAQFDNATIFQGPHQHRDVIGRVMRVCLSLGVVPVFVPPREPGFQAAIESFNGRWQAKVWTRFQHASLPALRDQSDRYVAASRRRAALRIDAAPPRRPFPLPWHLDVQAQPAGLVIFIRRTSDAGTVDVLGHRLAVSQHWPHRLVRCEVDLDHERIRIYALRRRAPHDQPLLLELPYVLPRRRFRE